MMKDRPPSPRRSIGTCRDMLSSVTALLLANVMISSAMLRREPLAPVSVASFGVNTTALSPPPALSATMLPSGYPQMRKHIPSLASS